MIKWQKPVRKCSGCKLNLGDRCAVFENPRDKWRRGRCSGYNDPELIKKWSEEQAKHLPKETKEKRKMIAKKRRTEEHHQGKPKTSKLISH